MSRFFPGPKVKMQLSRNYFPSKLAEAILKYDDSFEKIISISLVGDREILRKHGVSFVLFKAEKFFDGRISASIVAKSQSINSISKTKIWDLKSPKSSQKAIEKDISNMINEVCQDFIQRINGIGKYSF